MNVWGGCGADLVLLRGVGHCEELPLWCVDSCLDADDRLRGRDGGRNDDGAKDVSFMLGCNEAGAGGLSSVTRDPRRGSKGDVAALPKQFPMEEGEGEAVRSVG